MGRAQVIQAEASGIPPETAMNPILLKPTNDTGSQVIINGEVFQNMSARDYFTFKKELIPEIMKSYNNLSERFDIIVLEGAGSPAEINLKQDDIVNMGMAEMADAPVLLVGDIDRGGVFAQLLGTIQLLEESERDRIKGLIINKFRGDRSILDPGIWELEERAGIPVLGVTPYMKLDIEDEDSLSDRLDVRKETGLIDIAVIRIPRISNFTDFNALSCMEGVSVRYVTSILELKHPDLILLPGTKNTMEDLLWMRQNGLETAILKECGAGTLIFGICGGYQMLGEILSDPLGVESGGEIRGMGLLAMKTIFTGEKTRTRVQGTVNEVTGVYSKLNGRVFEGYEIHMGKTQFLADLPSFGTMKDQVSGTVSMDGAVSGNVCGTYVHGIFDRSEIATGLIEIIAQKKGIEIAELPQFDYGAYKETQYDLLADQLRESLDLPSIYAAMGIHREESANEN